MAMKEEQNSHQRDAHLVFHGSSSWLFIRRRGRLCRRWMFLWTTRGTCSTFRFSAVVSWVELLIDFGSTAFFRIYWKSPRRGWFAFKSTSGHLTWLLSHLLCRNLMINQPFQWWIILVATECKFCCKGRFNLCHFSSFQLNCNSWTNSAMIHA